MSGAPFLPRGTWAHPRVLRHRVHQCAGCGDLIPRRRTWCVTCATNPERIAARRHAWYVRHRAQEIARTRAYAVGHQDERRVWGRQYYARHREQLTARKRAAYARQRAA
jgi:hypothetical protein